MAWRFALLLVIATRAFPCSCSGNWPSVKQAWEKAPFVFLGTVEMADPDEDSRQTEFQEQSVRIHIDEGFKGVSRGPTIELHQGGTDCDAKFRTGQRAVFYLHAGAVPGSFSVPWCTRALGNAESGGDDLLFLRGLPKSAIGTRLSGAIELYEDPPRAGGVSDVSVKIVGPRRLTREAVTNAAGVYEVFGLRPGRYSVSIEVPKGLKLNFPRVSGSAGVPGDGASVVLAPNGGAGVDFVLQADTRLSGRMLDAQGAPMTGVCVDFEPVEGPRENGARFFDCSNEGGGFTMEMMPPGKYLLVAHDDVHWDLLQSKSTLYYPGVRDRQLAAVVSIAAGAYVENIEVQLPRDERRYKIAGKLRFNDGAPVADASVTFTSPEHGYSEATRTGPDGSFGLPVIAGMEGRLNGQLGVLEPILRSCPELRVGSRRRGMIRSIDGEPVTLSADSDHEGIELQLSSPSCKSLPIGRR
jgi:hypothetical protein